VDRNKYQIQIPLPPKIDPTVTMMTVEEKPDVTYSDIGGCKEQIEKMREVVELPMLHPEKFVQLGIDPPKGVLCYGPPGEPVGEPVVDVPSAVFEGCINIFLHHHQCLSGKRGMGVVQPLSKEC
jgi:hypothetical protein